MTDEPGHGMPEEHLLAALDTAAIPVFMTRGLAHLVEYANAAFEATFGPMAIGEPARFILDAGPDLVTSFFDKTLEAGRAFRSTEVPIVMVWPGERSARTRYFDVSISVTGPPSQPERGLLVFALEVTEVMEARQRLEEYARLQQILAGASAALNSELDPLVELQQLAQVVVPGLADFASVHVLDLSARPGEMPTLPVYTTRVAVAAIPDLGDLPALSSNLRWDGDGDPITNAIANGRLLREPFVTPTAPAWSEQTGSGPAIRAGLNNIILAPVIADGMVIAVVSFGMCGDRPVWTESEYGALEEVARLAGVALGHGMSYQRTRETSLILQRSMLTEPPDIDGLDIAVRYRPSGHDEVGGDWYDAFPLGRQRGTAVVVGDIVGHDTEAAAAMGQLRASLRTIALDSQSTPANVLSRLARVNAHLKIVHLATLVYAQLSPEPGGGWTMRWSNAGHPPPILVGPDGARVLEEGFGPALVPLAGGAHREARVPLPVGSTLILYTDGLIERRGIDLQDSLLELRRKAGSMGDVPLDDICEALLSGAPTSDDIALLVLRVSERTGPQP